MPFFRSSKSTTSSSLVSPSASIVAPKAGTRARSTTVPTYTRSPPQGTTTATNNSDGVISFHDLVSRSNSSASFFTNGSDARSEPSTEEPPTIPRRSSRRNPAPQAQDTVEDKPPAYDSNTKYAPSIRRRATTLQPFIQSSWQLLQPPA